MGTREVSDIEMWAAWANTRRIKRCGDCSGYEIAGVSREDKEMWALVVGAVKMWDRQIPEVI